MEPAASRPTPAGAAQPRAGASPPREQWTGQIGFILSAIGSAVGLGNIWRFPGVAYENGGGAFLIPYLIALVTAGIPILFLDYTIGHRFRGSAPTAPSWHWPSGRATSARRCGAIRTTRRRSMG